MACTAVTRETHLSWRDRENGIGPRVLLPRKHLRTKLASRANLWEGTKRDILGKQRLREAVNDQIGIEPF